MFTGAPVSVPCARSTHSKRQNESALMVLTVSCEGGESTTWVKPTGGKQVTGVPPKTET